MRREFAPTFESFCLILEEVKAGNRNSVPIEIVQSLCQKSLESNNPWDAQRIALAAIENSGFIEYFDQNLLNPYAGLGENLMERVRSNGNGH